MNLQININRMLGVIATRVLKEVIWSTKFFYNKKKMLKKAIGLRGVLRKGNKRFLRYGIR